MRLGASLLLLVAAACAAGAAARAVAPHGCGCSHHGHGAHHHSHDARSAVAHHGGGGWMRRPFEFEAQFEGDGSCEVERKGDGRGGLSGSDECEKNIRARMRFTCERGGGEQPGNSGGGSSSSSSSSSSGSAAAGAQAALGQALAARLGAAAEGDAPPGFLEQYVASALAEAAPEAMAAALQDGRGVELEARSRMSIKCASAHACQRLPALPAPSAAPPLHALPGCAADAAAATQARSAKRRRTRSQRSPTAAAVAMARPCARGCAAR